MPLGILSMTHATKYALLLLAMVGLFGCFEQSANDLNTPDVSLTETPTIPTYVIAVSTAEIITFNGGSIHGIITSADKINEPWPNVTVMLETHPFFNESNRIKVIATTTTDSQGRFSFNQVEPGVYALHTRISLIGVCESTNLSKHIDVEVGSVVSVNLLLTCP
jgi:hypothetical protein